jgi:hypothetical protein
LPWVALQNKPFDIAVSVPQNQAMTSQINAGSGRQSTSYEPVERKQEAVDPALIRSGCERSGR